MNGHYLLNPTTTSVINATVFYYIHVTSLVSTCHNCVYVKPKSSRDATMAPANYAYQLVMVRYSATVYH